MREWWADLLIQTAGGMFGTVAAAALIAFAGKAAGLFDSAREFSLRAFAVYIVEFGGVVGVLIALLAMIVSIISR